METLMAAVLEVEAARERASYPPLLDQLLPTRLGNVLRANELTAGRAYNLDAIASFPRVAMLAPAGQIEYVQDQRLQLELAVRTSVLGLVGTCVTVLFMWWHGLWVLLALIPYGLAYLSYRGAVVMAASYGTAVATVLELNRFSLYKHMGLPFPDCTATEREQNGRLMAAFGHDAEVDLQYAIPPEVASAAEDRS